MRHALAIDVMLISLTPCLSIEANLGPMERTTKPSMLPLPEEFLGFLRENNIDSSIYGATDSVPRYIRVKPGNEACLQELEAEIKSKPLKLEWLTGFYSLPNNVQIANTRLYKHGLIYGIDAASGAAVSALNILAGDHVLDLCSAPGAKLCMILEILGDSGSVTGVDVSQHRLAACRTMLQKYSLGDRCRLFVADGTTFSLIPTKRINYIDKACCSTSQENVDVFHEWTSRRPWKERKKTARQRQIGFSKISSVLQPPELIFYGKKSGVIGLSIDEVFQSIPGTDVSGCGYDKVLVDAECTHDGSVRHIQKFEQWGWETLQQRVLNAERTDSLTVLQLKLLTNGFQLLKVGGSLVYSTCSLTIAQNEDVVEQFLQENASAVLQEVEGAKSWPYVHLLYFTSVTALVLLETIITSQFRSSESCNCGDLHPKSWKQVEPQRVNEGEVPAVATSDPNSYRALNISKILADEENAVLANADEEQSDHNKVNPSQPYMIGRKISKWDQLRAEWLKNNPSRPSTVGPSKMPRVLLVTGSSSELCENPVGDHLLLKSIKNKMDYDQSYKFYRLLFLS
ncbi:hypothetical protein SAY87_016497 [Trapa incisa]|uniref:SAM-dependent MTase RsmB/NOP-type domain-containing protein n=1 Tax=Trapa incisa TaxID=236973 RepID=A0AAN7QXJ5_9MYRT|nr:hypothetical protein SAY87_016497 [Trapa incisa]